MFACVQVGSRVVMGVYMHTCLPCAYIIFLSCVHNTYVLLHVLASVQFDSTCSTRFNTVLVECTSTFWQVDSQEYLPPSLQLQARGLNV